MNNQHTVGSVTFNHRPHPRSKSIKIRIEQDGQVIVSSPKRTSLQSIKSFVLEKEPWINGTVQKIKASLQSTDSSSLLLFGETYQRIITTDATIPRGVHFRENQALIRVSDPNSATAVQKTIERFLKNTAEEYIVPRTHQLATKMQLTFNRISLKSQKTRWGSCSSQGNLNFNWRLVQYPPNIIDYVIIHELAHLEQMNHSAAFWQLVEQYDPAYRQHRGWLKRHGMTVG